MEDSFQMRVRNVKVRTEAGLISELNEVQVIAVLSATCRPEIAERLKQLKGRLISLEVKDGS